MFGLACVNILPMSYVSQYLFGYPKLVASMWEPLYHNEGTVEYQCLPAMSCISPTIHLSFYSAT